MIEILQQIPIQLLLLGTIIILGGRWISKKATSTSARLFWVVLGLYFLSLKIDISNSKLILDIDFFLSIGFVLPHIKYFVNYFADFIKTTIAVTYNAYTLWLSIYYKIRNIFLWIFDKYQKIQIFFAKKRYEKTKQEYEEKQEQKQKKEENNSYYEKQDYSYNYQDEQYSSNNETTNNPYGIEYNQFFMDNWYDVLGISENSPFSEIKVIAILNQTQAYCKS